jgi:hypothetical protein
LGCLIFNPLPSVPSKDGVKNENWGAELKIIRKMEGLGNLPREGVCIADSYRHVLDRTGKEVDNKWYNWDTRLNASKNLSDQQIRDAQQRMFRRFRFFPQEELLSGNVLILVTV